MSVLIRYGSTSGQSALERDFVQHHLVRRGQIGRSGLVSAPRSYLVPLFQHALCMRQRPYPKFEHFADIITSHHTCSLAAIRRTRSSGHVNGVLTNTKLHHDMQAAVSHPDRLSLADLVFRDCIIVAFLRAHSPAGFYICDLGAFEDLSAAFGCSLGATAA